MHQDTVRELIESGSTAVGSLLKELLVHQKQVDIMERRKDKEIELAEVKAQARQQNPQPESHDHDQGGNNGIDAGVLQQGDRLSATPAELEEAIDELMDEEMCDVCRDLLAGLKLRPPKEQARGLMEYGKFKHRLDTGATVDDLKAELKKTDVLLSVFQEKFTGSGLNG